MAFFFKFIGFVFLGFAAILNTARAASFDCKKAQTSIEITICKYPELSALDELLNATWKTVRTKVALDEQRTWLEKRDACGNNPYCLENEISTRIGDLIANTNGLPTCPRSGSVQSVNASHDISAEWNNCNGTIFYAGIPAGDVISGAWKSGKLDGYGSYFHTLKNKRDAIAESESLLRYSGYWKNGKRDGLGVQTYYGGLSAKIGVWENSNFQFEAALNNAPALETEFLKLSELSRKQIQLNLNSLGLYSSTIDGFWGGGTERGLRSFNRQHLNDGDVFNSVSAKNILGMILNFDSDSTKMAAKDCSKEVKACSDQILCNRGTIIKSFRKVWDSQPEFMKYVQEAQRRGLLCDVQDLAPSPFTKLTNSSLPHCEKSVARSKWSNCLGQFKSSDGNIYNGSFLNGQLDGEGTADFSDGARYVGQFKNGKAEGEGTLIAPDGGTYTGYFMDEKFNGQGTYVFKDGAKYVGQFKDGFFNGEGKMNVPGEWAFVGTFKNGLRDGRGTTTYSTGAKYVGDYLNDKIAGYGTLSSPDGQIYEGSFKDGNQNGSGRTIFENGLQHVGQYRDGKRNGEGEAVLLNGERVKGFWLDGKPIELEGVPIPTLDECSTNIPTEKWSNCFGSYVSNNGNEYYGEFQGGNFNGRGVFILAGGDKYIGLFQDDQFEGRGVYVSADGRRYEGDFKKGTFNGVGTLTGNGLTYTGEFQNDRFNGSGELTIEDEFKYVGEFENDLFNGAGTLTDMDGAELKGIWKDNELVTAENAASSNSSETLKVASGTGFYVSNSGHIITNYHVIEGCKDVKAHSKGRELDAVIIANDRANDLAVLKISESPDYFFALSQDSPYPLQDIIVAGYPFGDAVSSSVKFTRGIVSSLTGINNNYSEIQIDAALQPGNSGGPIMDDYGNVIAVAVAKLDEDIIKEDFGVIPENTNFGVKVSAVKNLMEGNRITFKVPNTLIIDKQELSRQATDGTVYLTCWMTVAQIEQMKNIKVMFKEIQ